MRVGFHNTKELKNKSPLNDNKNLYRRTMMALLTRKNSIIDNIKKNIMAKEELNKYFKYSEKLRRRHSICSIKKRKQTKRNYERSKTFWHKSKMRVKIFTSNRQNIQEVTAERIYDNLNEVFSFENNEERVNFLIKLNPFYQKLNEIEKHGEIIIRTISPEYKGTRYPPNQVIFRYGDEVTDFYLIHKGKVNLYFPYTESLYMNIDEYFIYLMRLRRYGEIEMLNDVLLMNKNIFMREVEEPFDFDNFIVKLYNTFIKIKFSPVFLAQKESKKYNSNNSSSNDLNNKRNSKKKVYINENEFNDDVYKTFTDKEMKNLALRIENELIETIKWIRPEELRQIIKEEVDGDTVKKIVKIPEYLVQKFTLLHPDEIKRDTTYNGRIEPVQIFNTNLQRQKVTIMRYLFLKTLTKGEYFGEYTNDSSYLFHSKLLYDMKHSKLNLKIHKYSYFRNTSVVAIRDNSEEYNGNLYLGIIDKGLYIQYFRKFIEKVNYSKKKFLLNSRLFKNCRNENLVKGYSSCFQLKVLKENDCLINEKTILTGDNTFIYFINKGNFQSMCNQTVQSIDKILTHLGFQDKISNTIPLKLNKIKDTFFYEEICKKELKIKLNYLTENDVVGLSENILRDKYFNSVVCMSKEGSAYYVDSRIIKLFVESDTNIRDNKNLLLYNKYKVLCDALLKQRKSYLDSFCSFQIDSVKEKEKALTKFAKKRYNIFHNKEKFKKILTPSTTKYLNIKEKERKVNEPKYKVYKSLSYVCDVLSKVSDRVTLEDKRRERTLLFKKKYMLENEKNKQYKSYNSKDLTMTLDLVQEIEYQKNNYICFKDFKKYRSSSVTPHKINRSKKINKGLNTYKNKNRNILNIKKNFFKDEENKFVGDAGQILTPLNQHFSKKRSKIEILNDLNSFKINEYGSNNSIFKKRKKSNIHLNEVNKIRLNRKTMLTKKLRNIYSGDLEQILLNEHINNIFY